ncbi:MAG: FG-GAP repeat domain-containing protein, partial [Wenzhouxiangellaceae bacterium]
MPLRHRSPRLAPLMLVAGISGASSAGETTLYTDVTEAAGIEAALTHDKPAGGIGVGDFNRDGWPDLFLTGYFEANKLYFNNGQGGFEEDPAIAAQVAMPGSRCTGVAVADHDNDGWSDIYLVCNGDNRLLRNLQGAGFQPDTPPLFNHPGRSEAAAWADLNHDGILDLVIAAHPSAYPYDPNDPDNYDRILISGPSGSHFDLAPALAIATPLAATLALIAADLDLDGRMDLYFANDRHDGNTLLLNRGPGCAGWCFEDVSALSGARRPAYSMGIAAADYDRDGDVDLYY